MRRTLDASGTLTSQQRYLPFGAVRDNVPAPNGLPTTDLGYTGQRDLGMGLMDYHARFYSPSLGRFTQPDSIIPDLSNPQAWNRFSYVVNRPINLNDPTGHCFEPVSMVICGIGLVLIGTAMIMNGRSEMNAAAQQPTFLREQEAIENWQDNCMGSCHYSEHVSLKPNSTTGPRPNTSTADRYSKGMADVVVGALAIVDGANGVVSGTTKLMMGANDWAQLSGQLQAAAKGKGNFGIGSATAEQADAMGNAWVGRILT